MDALNLHACMVAASLLCAWSNLWRLRELRSRVMGEIRVNGVGAPCCSSSLYHAMNSTPKPSFRWKFICNFCNSHLLFFQVFDYLPRFGYLYLCYRYPYRFKHVIDIVITSVVFAGGTGDVSRSVEFGISPTGIGFDIPGWDPKHPFTGMKAKKR